MWTLWDRQGSSTVPGRDSAKHHDSGWRPTWLTNGFGHKTSALEALRSVFIPLQNTHVGLPTTGVFQIGGGGGGVTFDRARKSLHGAGGGGGNPTKHGFWTSPPSFYEEIMPCAPWVVNVTPPPFYRGMVSCGRTWLETHSLPTHTESQCLLSEHCHQSFQTTNPKRWKCYPPSIRQHRSMGFKVGSLAST